MAPRFKILMSSGSKKETQIYHPFHSKKSQQAHPLQVAQWGPYGERYQLTGHFYVSLNISFYLSLRVPGKGAPSMFPNRVPMDRDTPSPEPVVYLFIHSFIHVCLLESPNRSPPTYGEKHLVTVHRAPCRRKAYIQWGAAWFPKNLWCKSHSLSSYYYSPNTSIQQWTKIWLYLPQFSSSHGRAVKACKRNCESNIYSTKDHSCT